MITIKGRLTDITYQRKGFTVGMFMLANKIDSFQAIGNIYANKDDLISITGEFKSSAKYGKQFVVKHMEHCKEHVLDGLKVYLAKELKGVGKKTANKIVDELGVDTLHKLEDNPNLLKTIGLEKVISQVKSIKFDHLKAWAYGNNITERELKRLKHRFGKGLQVKLEENPYIMMDIYGFTFKRADSIALRMGIEKNSIERSEAACSYLLEEAVNNGSTYLSEGEMVQGIIQLTEVEGNTALIAIQSAHTKGSVYREEFKLPDGQAIPVIYKPELYYVEKKLAECIKEKVKYGNKGLEEDKYGNDRYVAAKALGIELDKSQHLAIMNAFNNKISIITGGPGVGKSLISNIICKIASKEGYTIGLVAPTGRAANRLAELSGLEAKTIHRMLKYMPRTGEFLYNSENTLPINLLIIDEMSMVDTDLAYRIISSTDINCKLILIGDANQLPSIGPGRVLKDLIKSGKISTTKLDKIYRHDEYSLIAKNADAVIHGEMPVFPPNPKEIVSDSYLLDYPKEDPKQIKDCVIELVKNRIPKKFGVDPMYGVQVISPMKRNETGTWALNKALKKALNGDSKEVTIGGVAFSVGDKVIRTNKNDYENDVFNSDLGYVKEVNPTQIVIDFYGKTVIYNEKDIKNLELAYATTSHRSQGAEYSAVVLVLVKANYIMLDRQLLYTSMTRAKKLLVIVGSKAAIQIAVNSNKVKDRNSLLARRLQC